MSVKWSSQAAWPRIIRPVTIVVTVLAAALSLGVAAGCCPLSAPRFSRKNFSVRTMTSLNDEQAKALGEQLVRTSLRRHATATSTLAPLFPSPAEVLAMLARDRDVDDFAELSSLDGAAGQRYQHIVDLVPTLRPLRQGYEALFSGAYAALVDAKKVLVPTDAYPRAGEYIQGITLPRESSVPVRKEYEKSHTYALDIFYANSEEDPFGSGEKGPMVFSLSKGIVVAAASDWRGGCGIQAYKSGGISPNAGNGVIIYDPAARRFYLYFHLHSAALMPGQAVQRGQPVGFGGDSGANARIPGHGQHLHLEIYEAAQARFLKHYEILTLVAGT